MGSRHKTGIIMTCSDYCPTAKQYVDGVRISYTCTENGGETHATLARCGYVFGGQPVYWYATDYDLIGRPANATDSVSLMREWQYNRRSELAAATIGLNHFGYAYDTIGNRLWSAANLTTNSYTANNLNQYSSILRASAPPREPTYDADGNMTDDGVFAYAYDAENRLVSVTSASPTNGAVRVLNAYDHRNRRIRKTVQRLYSTSAPPPAPPTGTDEWQTLETHTFVWDGNNIVLEEVEFADGTIRTIENFWGLDKSGTEQGAGGVGGLLAVSLDDVFYIPCYDHNGNIVLYVSKTGSVAAQYTYDPYGNVIESSGPLANMFSFGFSTHYHDRETGMVGYKRRFYRPDLGRWLNRDPIEEEGGENLYAFCKNNPVFYFDNAGTEVYAAITLKRNHLELISAIREDLTRQYSNEDTWGHWWIEFDDESYGWWPSNHVADIKTAIKGVPGELNGQKSFGGTATKDPHHGKKAEQEFHPQRQNTGTMKYGRAKGKKCNCTKEDDAKDCIRNFAKSYSGEWRWPNKTCQTFQLEGMSNCCLAR